MDADGALFAIGDFTHYNFPVPSGSGISSVEFLLDITGNSQILSATFDFDHNETPNGGADPRDIVTITDGILNQSFDYLGDTFYFNLVGFSQDNG